MAPHQDDRAGTRQQALAGPGKSIPCPTPLEVGKNMSAQATPAAGTGTRATQARRAAAAGFCQHNAHHGGTQPARATQTGAD